MFLFVIVMEYNNYNVNPFINSDEGNFYLTNDWWSNWYSGLDFYYVRWFGENYTGTINMA